MPLGGLTQEDLGALKDILWRGAQGGKGGRWDVPAAWTALPSWTALWPVSWDDHYQLEYPAHADALLTQIQAATMDVTLTSRFADVAPGRWLVWAWARVQAFERAGRTLAESDSARTAFLPVLTSWLPAFYAGLRGRGYLAAEAWSELIRLVGPVFLNALDRDRQRDAVESWRMGAASENQAPLARVQEARRTVQAATAMWTSLVARVPYFVDTTTRRSNSHFAAYHLGLVVEAAKHGAPGFTPNDDDKGLVWDAADVARIQGALGAALEALGTMPWATLDRPSLPNYDAEITGLMLDLEAWLSVRTLAVTDPTWAVEKLRGINAASQGGHGAPGWVDRVEDYREPPSFLQGALESLASIALLIPVVGTFASVGIRLVGGGPRGYHPGVPGHWEGAGDGAWLLDDDLIGYRQALAQYAPLRAALLTRFQAWRAQAGRVAPAVPDPLGVDLPPHAERFGRLVAPLTAQMPALAWGDIQGAVSRITEGAANAARVPHGTAWEDPRATEPLTRWIEVVSTLFPDFWTPERVAWITSQITSMRLALRSVPRPTWSMIYGFGGTLDTWRALAAWLARPAPPTPDLITGDNILAMWQQENEGQGSQMLTLPNAQTLADQAAEETNGAWGARQRDEAALEAIWAQALAPWAVRWTAALAAFERDPATFTPDLVPEKDAAVVLRQLTTANLQSPFFRATFPYQRAGLPDPDLHAHPAVTRPLAALVTQIANLLEHGVPDAVVIAAPWIAAHRANADTWADTLLLTLASVAVVPAPEAGPPEDEATEAPEGEDADVPVEENADVPEGEDADVPEGEDPDVPEGEDADVPEGEDVEVPEGEDETPETRGDVDEDTGVALAGFAVRHRLRGAGG